MVSFSESLFVLIFSSLFLELPGRRFGSTGLYCLAFLFFPLARGSVLLRIIDIPFEQATRYHVWLGNLTMLLFTIHGLFFVIAWTIEGNLLQEVSSNACCNSLLGIFVCFLQETYIYNHSKLNDPLR
jgi:ferric-chelate reductase